MKRKRYIRKGPLKTGTRPEVRSSNRRRRGARLAGREGGICKDAKIGGGRDTDEDFRELRSVLRRRPDTNGENYGGSRPRCYMDNLSEKLYREMLGVRSYFLKLNGRKVIW